RRLGSAFGQAAEKRNAQGLRGLAARHVHHTRRSGEQRHPSVHPQLGCRFSSRNRSPARLPLCRPAIIPIFDLPTIEPPHLSLDASSKTKEHFMSTFKDKVALVT